MTTLVRKGFGNIRNINKCRSLCVGFYCKVSSQITETLPRVLVVAEQLFTTDRGCSDNNFETRFKITEYGQGQND